MSKTSRILGGQNQRDGTGNVGVGAAGDADRQIPQHRTATMSSKIGVFGDGVGDVGMGALKLVQKRKGVARHKRQKMSSRMMSKSVGGGVVGDRIGAVAIWRRR